MLASRYCAVVVASSKQQPQKRKFKVPTRKESARFEELTQESGFESVSSQDDDGEERGKLSKSNTQAISQTISRADLPGDSSAPVAERGAVLKACISTSAGLSLAGLSVRQLSHLAAVEGWPVPDCTMLLASRIEVWHSAPTLGVIVVVASLRQILLELWPAFAESSQLANRQVLSSLQPVDFFTVSYLSGISEELFFRGALLPLIGADWKGAIGAGLVFGALHLSGGRNASFAVWASLVGILYGMLGLYTNDLAAPMAAHSIVNMLGAGIWKMRQDAQNTNKP